MADFTSQNQGGANVAQVQTSGIPFFAADGTMLRIGFKADTMFFTIIPRVEEGGRYRWPKEAGHTAAFKANYAMALFKGVTERLLPDIAEKKDHPGHVVVALNRDSTSLCGFGFMGGNATFSIFQNVSANRTTNEIYTFVFDSSPVIDKYNPLTGEYEVSEIQGALYCVLEALNVFAHTAIGSVGHTVKNVTNYNFSQLMSHLQAISSKLGATPAPYGPYNGAYGSGNRQGPSFGGGTSMEPDGQNAGASWAPASQASHDVGHITPPDIQQVSSLDNLMAG